MQLSPYGSLIQGCSLGLERLVSRLGLGFLRLVYIELQSSNWGLLSILYMGCLSISVKNRHLCLFLNYRLFNTIAIKNMNVMDVIKAWFALILLREQLIMFQSRKCMITIGTQCCIFITKTSLNFTMAKLLKLAVNYSWYHMAHAEPVYYR